MAVILFDGGCNLCDRTVRFVAARDPAGYFQFASLSSPAAARLLSGFREERPPPDSILLVEEGKVHTRSDAALRVARRLSFPWPLASLLRVIPRVLRDSVYDAIAVRRYRWFGRRDACQLPDPGIRARLLEDGV